TRLFEVFDLQPGGGFRNVGEQIDGSIQMGNDVFLVEAKWHKKPIPRADLAVFSDKVTGNAVGTRGLFFSISGYSEEGLIAFAKGKPTSIFGFDKADLEYVLDGKMTLPAAIALKIRHAGKTNELFKPLTALKKN
ncbi:MAG: restriction endonuclease, partial [bacterium]|nr:restriction endonuclease [bacterium]